MWYLPGGETKNLVPVSALDFDARKQSGVKQAEQMEKDVQTSRIPVWFDDSLNTREPPSDPGCSWDCVTSGADGGWKIEPCHKFITKEFESTLLEFSNIKFLVDCDDVLNDITAPSTPGLSVYRHSINITSLLLSQENSSSNSSTPKTATPSPASGSSAAAVAQIFDMAMGMGGDASLQGCASNEFFFIAGHMLDRALPDTEVHVGSKWDAANISFLADDNRMHYIGPLDTKRAPSGATSHVLCDVEMTDLDWSSDDEITYNNTILSPQLGDHRNLECIKKRTETQDSTNFFVFSDDVLESEDNKMQASPLSGSCLIKTPPPSPSLRNLWDSTGPKTLVGYDKEATLYRKEARLADKGTPADSARRGVNLRKNPKMQKMARDGQKHWHDKLMEMRVQYDMANIDMMHPQFAEQRLMCTVRDLKCQKESLLIFLHFAMQQRLISPLPFVHPGDASAGFLGWTGFFIHPGCGERFRAGVEALFPEPPKINTLYHLFRRSGIVPEDWRRAWDGKVPFLWKGKGTST